MRLVLPSFAVAALMIGCTPAASKGCFAPGTELPDREAVLRGPAIGESARALIEALYAGDATRAEALLRADRALAQVKLASGADMLSLAVSGCSREAVDSVLAADAPRDGQGGGLPLTLALRARDPWFAQRLLAAGASPNPNANPSVPMLTAIGLNAPAAVKMLLDAGADPNLAERTGNRPLQSALDMERFGIAELLLDRGADPWAIDAGGANLATSVATPMLTDDANERAAQRRLQARVRALGWPDPAPDPRRIRALALADAWPPAGAKAPPVPQSVLKLIAERAERR